MESGHRCWLVTPLLVPGTLIFSFTNFPVPATIVAMVFTANVILHQEVMTQTRVTFSESGQAWKVNLRNIPHVKGAARKRSGIRAPPQAGWPRYCPNS